MSQDNEIMWYEKDARYTARLEVTTAVLLVLFLSSLCATIATTAWLMDCRAACRQVQTRIQGSQR